MLTATWLITVSLCVLSAVDLLLAFWVFGFPDHFCRLLYGRSRPDPLGLLSRTGGFWLTFGIVQGMVVFLWPGNPELLAVVAGIRFSELITDWIYLTKREIFTWQGLTGYFLSVPYTVSFGCLMLYNAVVRIPFTDSFLLSVVPDSFGLTSFQVAILLFLLLTLDMLLGAVMFWVPERWVRFIHGFGGEDPFHLITRTSGVRFSFMLTQSMALILFPFSRIWLLVVAGLRFSEGIADWFCWATTSRLTASGRLYVLLLPLINLITGFTLFATYKSLL